MMIKDYHDDVLKVRVMIGSGGSISVSTSSAVSVNFPHAEERVVTLQSSELGKKTNLPLPEKFSWSHLIIRTDPANSK